VIGRLLVLREVGRLGRSGEGADRDFDFVLEALDEVSPVAGGEKRW